MSRKRRQQLAAARPIPTADRFLNRNGAFAFAAFFLFALWAFWPSYFSRLSSQPDFRLHTHGIAMTSWCVLLIAQAWLIRTRQKSFHRTLGKLSYVLVPFVVIATLNLVHSRVRGMTSPSPLGLFQLALMVNAVPVFVTLYALAMYYRRAPAIHARYMLCTVFPLFTPVTDRLIFSNFPSIAMMVPTLDGAPLVPVAGFLLADAILLGLVLWDGFSNQNWRVFPLALVLLVAYHASVLSFYRFEAWASFARWFAGLPLS